MFVLKVLIGLAITQALLVVAIDEELSKSTPKCSSFLTKARLECAPLSDLRVERGLSLKNPADNIEWTNIVIFMIAGKSQNIDDLLKAHFETWLNHVGKGLDLWFITDKDDNRSLEDIIPEKRNENINYRLHRSNAKNDGSHIRFKVIDSFKHLNRVYLKDRSKKFFYKMDTDTYLLPENLLSYTDKLNKEAQGLPVHVGRTMCVHEDVCHVSGALYGMNRIGFLVTYRYFATNPNLCESEVLAYNPKFKGGSVNLMLHEDFMVSYAFKMATNLPSTHQAQFHPYDYQRMGVGTNDSPAICYHQLKSLSQFIDHEALFYNERGGLRSYTELMQLLQTNMTRV